MDKDVIIQRIVYLNELLFELKNISQIEKEEFFNSKIYVSATENYLRKALQVIINLGEDIVSKNRLRSLFNLL